MIIQVIDTIMRKTVLKYAAPIAALMLVGAGCFGSPTTPVATPTPAPTPQGIAEGEPNPAGGTVPSSLGMRVAGNFIFVAAQRPGRTVTVHTLGTDASTIVVIRDSQTSNAASLGTSAVIAAGQVENVEVTLSRETKDGETLYAYAYVDDGDGQYDAGDTPLLDGQGNPLFARFDIDADAELNPQIAL